MFNSEFHTGRFFGELSILIKRKIRLTFTIGRRFANIGLSSRMSDDPDNPRKTAPLCTFRKMAVSTP